MTVNHVWQKYKIKENVTYGNYRVVTKGSPSPKYIDSDKEYPKSYEFDPKTGVFTFKDYFHPWTGDIIYAETSSYNAYFQPISGSSSYVAEVRVGSRFSKGDNYNVDYKAIMSSTRDKIVTKEKGDYIEDIKSPDKNAYPDNGEKNGYWYVYKGIDNQAPTISGEDTDLGEKNRPFEISYEAKDADTADNVTITEYLNNSVIRTISNANNTNQTLKITQELLNSCPLGETNTIKIYAEDSKGAGTYRKYYFRRTNTPPYFVEKNTDLGTISKAPTVQFTIKDDDGDNNLNVKVKLNQKVVKAYSRVASGTQLSYTMDWKDFMQLEGEVFHYIFVEVEDSSGGRNTLKYTLKRDVRQIEAVYWTEELDVKVNKIVFNANTTLQMDAVCEQYLCNDYGNGNHWEKITNNNAHVFKNKVEGRERIGYKIIINKSETGNNYLNEIGGSYI